MARRTLRRRPTRKAGKGFGIEAISDDARKAVISALRTAAKEVLNDLSMASPNWSGKFRQNWYVETKDGRRGVKSGNEAGKYNLFNIPQLDPPARGARGRFTSVLPASKGKIELFIGNSSPYATQAMDLEPYEYPNLPKGKRLPPPKGAIYEDGYRPEGGMRGEIEPQGFGDDAPPPHRSTAPLDWYSTYMEGGGFRAAFNKGAKAGFLEPVNKPRSPQ
jgi:hypothetical protein